MNLFKKYLPYFCLSAFSCCFVYWYLSAQQVIPDIAISFYHKYSNFNLMTDNNLFEGMQFLFESIQSDTRNLIFAFLLRPLWLIFGKSFETYTFGMFVLFFIPSMTACSLFINKFILNDCKEFPLFKTVVCFLLFSSPIFLYTLTIGYPDIFSVGFAVVAIYFFFKANILENFDWKNLAISSILFFLAFLFRRWLLFVLGSFLLSYSLFYSFKIITIKNYSPKEKLKKFVSLIKNILFFCMLFFALFFAFANNVLQDMFNPQFRQLFQDYAISFSQNFYAVLNWSNNCLFAVVFVYALCFTKTSRNIKNLLLNFKKIPKKNKKNFDNFNENYYENLEKRNDLFAFFFLYALIYFVSFYLTSEICIDHTMWLFLCGLICVTIALYSIIIVLPFKKFFAVLIMIFSLANLFFACSDNVKIKTSPILKSLFVRQVIVPNKVPNFEILKETENIIREKYKSNSKFRYSMWCFWNNIYNPHLIFQSAYDSDLFNAGVFPPLVDTEVIVSNWYSFEIFKVDTIFVLEPVQNYLQDKDKCKILSNTQKLLKNKQGFASAFELKNKKYFGEYNGQKIYVLQYDRIRPVTKSDQDDYYNRMLEWYPWAGEYFPDYFKNSWQN